MHDKLSMLSAQVRRGLCACIVKQMIPAIYSSEDASAQTISQFRKGKNNLSILT